MNTHLNRTILIISSILFLISCGDNKKHFIVEGKISEADTLTLFLERRGHADVTVLDSVKLTKDGDFSFKGEALNYSEFYRLRLENQSIDFSIDSTETITFTASRPTFASSYKVEGSFNSARIQEAAIEFNKLRSSINKLQKDHENKVITDQQYVDNITSVIEKYKAHAADMIVDEYKSTAAYYILFQKIDDLLIFDPYDKKDLNLFRAVATVWDTFFPESPRTVQLKDYTLNAIATKKRLEDQQKTFEKLSTQEVNENKELYVVEFPNVKGEKVSTKSLRGKVVLLDFTAYQSEYSVAHNVRLNQIYEKYKGRLEIYQVSFDTDKHFWMNGAANLPWICVRDQQSLNSALLPKFNIGGLPTTYLLSKEGEIIKRLSLNADLSNEIAKVL